MNGICSQLFFARLSKLFALGLLLVAVTASFAQMQVKNSPGTEVFMHVSPSGNVGVGTTLTPNKTNIAGNLAIGSAFSAMAAPANGLTVQGNVGVGSTAPDAKVRIEGTSVAALPMRSYISHAALVVSDQALPQNNDDKSNIIFSANLIKTTARTVGGNAHRIAIQGALTLTPGHDALQVSGGSLGYQSDYLGLIAGTVGSIQDDAAGQFPTGYIRTAGLFSNAQVSDDDYALRVTGGAKSYFSHAIGIGTTYPTANLTVVGHAGVFDFPDGGWYGGSLRNRAGIRVDILDATNDRGVLGVSAAVNPPGDASGTSIHIGTQGRLLNGTGTATLASGDLGAGAVHSNHMDVWGVSGRIDAKGIMDLYPSTLGFIASSYGLVDRNGISDGGPYPKAFAGFFDGAKSYFGGAVGIGATNPGAYMLFVQGDGYASGQFISGSDERFKKDIKPLDNVLERIDRLQGVSFSWRQEEFSERNFNDRTQIGVIAQQLEKEFPELVTTDKAGYKGVAYDRIGVILLEAVKELRKENQEMQKKMQAAGIE